MEAYHPKKIMARFVSVVGSWSEGVGFRNITSTTEMKEIEVVIDTSDPRGRTLKFIGGSTGYEEFYLTGVLHNFAQGKYGDFCICAGTINSWRECYVRIEDITRFLLEQGEKV